MNTYYVVSVADEDYNDEIYTIADYGHPIQIYQDKAIADEVCARLNLERAREIELPDYTYDEVPDDLVITSETSDEEVKQILRDYHIGNFYFVTEVKEGG